MPNKKLNFITYTPIELLGFLNSREKKYAPKRLYVCGSLQMPLSHPRVAIVGSRWPSKDSLKITKEIVSRLVQNKAIIVSGLAKGIDTAAHKTAIEKGGKTIAVLGTPLDKCYPKENINLQQTIMKDHLAISQFSTNHPILPRNFIMRNKTMTLISDVSIIIESRNSGGTIHYGWDAIKIGRPLFIWKDVIDNESLTEPRKMLKYGARKLTNIEEFIQFLSAKRQAFYKNNTINLRTGFKKKF